MFFETDLVPEKIFVSKIFLIFIGLNPKVILSDSLSLIIN